MQKLDNENVLITTVGGGGRSLEINAQGEIIWEGLYNLSLPDGAVYRANRIPGLYPAAYSILINDYMENSGDPGVYIPPGTSDISFSITNEGAYYIPLFIQITDDENWFESQNIEITIEPYSTQSISFTGNVINSTYPNTIQLFVEPTHHPSKAKTVFVNGFTNTLSNSNPINVYPGHLVLEKAYPNPFNSNISIHYSLQKEQTVLLQIFNINGKLIHTVIQEALSAGRHHSNWNAIHESSGVYVVKLTAPNQIETQKILYLK